MRSPQQSNNSIIIKGLEVQAGKVRNLLDHIASILASEHQEIRNENSEQVNKCDSRKPEE
jgi:hypothetical protein